MAQIRENINLADYTSFGASAVADRLVEWNSVGDLLAYLSAEGKNHLAGKWTLLGEGCNTLFTEDYHGTIIRSTAKGIAVLENLSAIPSSVGASAVQNIGAYGVEAKDIIEWVEVVRLDNLATEQLPNCECHFGYRESIFKEELAGKVIITAVCYRLHKSATPKLDYGTLRPEVEHIGDFSPEGIRRAVVAIRESKLPDPKVIGNAGSFFKNPILPRDQVEALKEQYPEMPIYEVAGAPESLKIATGWLIDSLGWKGKSLGRAGVHSRQALVLVNLGGATGEEVMALAERICHEVNEKFGVEISPEVNVL